MQSDNYVGFGRGCVGYSGVEYPSEIKISRKLMYLLADKASRCPYELNENGV